MSKDTQVIKSGKLTVGSAFTKDGNDELWYKIPNYQRPYVWGKDQIETLLENTKFAMEKDSDSQYFLGSLVLHDKKESQDNFIERHVLDGQQRLTTLLLLFACIRDLSNDEDTKEPCREMIFKKGNQRTKTPERKRIVFEIREEVDNFIEDYIKNDQSTDNEKKLQDIIELANIKKGSVHISVENMANAILIIRNWIKKQVDFSIDDLFTFLYSNVILIYVSSQDQEDALRMFTIINDTGIKLRNSDILKAVNLNEIKDGPERAKWAKYWEKIESELDDGFDEFLSHIRTVLTKDRADYSLIKEFEDKIYSKKIYDKSQKKWIEKDNPILTKGGATFEIIKKYKEHFDSLTDNSTYNNEIYNLFRILEQTSFSNIWLPPLLCFINSFGKNGLCQFFKKLDNKFSYDWITGASPTNRIDNMNRIISFIEEIKKTNNSEDEKVKLILNSDLFKVNTVELINAIDVVDVYKQRWIRYILYKLDMIYADHSSIFAELKTISTEHILPQNPDKSSKWRKLFSDDDRSEWTNKIGNLILISKRKNSSLGNSDYKEKKLKYFGKNIQDIKHSNHVIQNNSIWDIDALKNNHSRVLTDIKELYK